MRIISGLWGSRRLQAPQGIQTRPTQDRIREALFNICGDITGSRWLDLCAGSGAIGLEALSRGAERALFIDSSREAIQAIGANIKALGCAESCRVLQLDALSGLERCARDGERFTYAYFDPPYHDQKLLQEVVEWFTQHDLLEGQLFVEHGKGLHTPTTRKYGDTYLTCLSVGNVL